MSLKQFKQVKLCLFPEVQYDQVGTEIAIIKNVLQKLFMTNNILTHILLRAETVIERQQADVILLRMRMVQDTIIVRTKGTDYQGREKESTTATFKAFIEKELHAVDAGGTDISRPNQMEQANNDYNRMIIAKVPSYYDQRHVFWNARVLPNTNYSISKQLSVEVE